jgi:hypothetical protein
MQCVQNDRSRDGAGVRRKLLCAVITNCSERYHGTIVESIRGRVVILRQAQDDHFDMLRVTSFDSSASSELRVITLSLI